MKGAKYRGLGKPFLIALLIHDPSVFRDEEFWRQIDESKLRLPREVSGILLGLNIYPWNLGRVTPRLIRNPESDYPLPNITWSIPGNQSAAPFGLDADWPGPEPPFASS